MAQEQKKLNAMRLLENQGIAYETFTYEPAIQDGVHAAEAMGQPVEQVFKTLVVQLGKGDHALVMVPAGRTLDLKKFRPRCRREESDHDHAARRRRRRPVEEGGIGAWR